MPKTIINRSASPGTRKNSVRRNRKPKQGCQGRGRQSKKASPFIANSLFALTLKPISGINVECRKSNLTGVNRMLNDLLKCYNKIVPAGNPAIPHYYPVDKKVECIMKLIRQAIPKPYKINIDQIKGAYCVAVYAYCPYKNYLPAIQVGPAILKLKDDYPALHDIFLMFLKSFIRTTKVDTWWDELYSMGIESLDDMTCQDDPQMDQEFVEEAIADIKIYREGDAAYYQQKILAGKRIKSTPEILRMVGRLRRKNPVIKIIEDGCKIIDTGMNMFKYRYQPDGEKNEDGWDIEPLRFENQAMIFWNADGHCSAEYDQWIDMQAGEGGVDEPVFAEILNPGQKSSFDIEAFKEKCLWPARLADFFAETIESLKKYTK